MFPTVKRCLCLIFSLSLLPLPGNEPGGAAIAFLEKVRDGEIDLQPGSDTALQENTSEEKRENIRLRLERLTEDLKGGKLELGEVKEDENFAAVMVKRVGGFDTARLQMVPVALVRENQKWLPAPLPASFENAVAGYSVPVRDRLAKLENWMARRRVTDLDKLIADSAERTRREIRESIVGEELESDDLQKIIRSFLAACAKRDRAAVLGFLGGLSDPLPDDWSARLRASEAVSAADPNAKDAWRLLVAPEVVRVIVSEEISKNSGMISIVCLDPALAPGRGTLEKLKLIHLEFSRGAEGRWRIDLPEGLLQNDIDELSADEDLDVDLLDLFTKKLREHEPVIGEKTAQEAKVAVMTGLQKDGLRALLQRVDFEGEPKDARIAAAAAAEVWWAMNDPRSLHFPLELGFKQEGVFAAAVYQWFSPVNADRFEMQTLYFKKAGAGWVWAPGVVSAEEQDARKALSSWVKQELPNWRISWREKLLEPSVKIEKIDFASLATDGEIKNLSDKWFAAMDSQNLEAVLSLTAWLGGNEEIPMKALRNISYDLSQAQADSVAENTIYRSDSWVATTVSRGAGADVRHLFLPVLSTPDGPRFLPGIDLVASDDRTRKFLNEGSFERLQRIAGAEKTEELKKLFSDFVQAVKNR